MAARQLGHVPCSCAQRTRQERCVKALQRGNAVSSASGSDEGARRQIGHAATAGTSNSGVTSPRKAHGAASGTDESVEEGRRGRGCPARSMGQKLGRAAVKEPLATSCSVQLQRDDILYCTDARNGAMPGVQRQKKAASGCSPVKTSGQSSRRGFQNAQTQLRWQDENAVNRRPAAWQAYYGCLAKPSFLSVGAQGGRAWQAEMRPRLTRAAKAKEGSEARTGSGGPHGQACVTLLLKRTGVLWPTLVVFGVFRLPCTGHKLPT